MRNQLISLSILFFLFCKPFSHVYGQCLTAPAATCNGTEPLVTDGETLNEGTTKWYYGAVATHNVLRMNGGTLIVAGDLTINQFYMDSGRIFVQPGARFVIGNGIGAGLVLRGHCYLYNYGRLEILRNLSLESGWASPTKPNVVNNASLSAVFRMANQYFVINNANSWFVNRGRADFHGLIIDPQSSPGSVCLGMSSQTVMTVLYNKVKRSYVAPNPYACLSVSQFSQIWDTLTSSPNINVCLGMTHRTDSTCMPFGCKPSWGMANLFRGCLTCQMIEILSNGFISFSMQQADDRIKLYWEMENYFPSSVFYIERSEDGQHFKSIGSFTGDRSPTARYSYTDESPVPGTSYYRIKHVSPVSEMASYSPVIKVMHKGSGISVYPNPFTDHVFVSVPVAGSEMQCIVEDVTGTRISVQELPAGTLKREIRFPANTAAGTYIITIVDGTHIWKKKVIKQ